MENSAFLKKKKKHSATTGFSQKSDSPFDLLMHSALFCESRELCGDPALSSALPSTRALPLCGCSVRSPFVTRHYRQQASELQKGLSSGEERLVLAPPRRLGGRPGF